MIEEREGTVIRGKYRLERLIARGGMGAVWAARDEQLRRPVAVKLMSPQFVDVPLARSRFEREAVAAAQLQTPHVVQVYDHGVDAGSPFIVMELLHGEDLSQRLKHVRRYSLGEAADLATQMARGLRKAHEIGIVHRDLKPPNVYLAKADDGEVVKILDFGVAKALVDGVDGESTTTGMLVGSPHYMSPEQARGLRDVDHRSDLWSFAVILYRVLSGHAPFRGEATGDVIVRICADPLPRLSECAPDLPAELDAFFDRALCRDPAGRFQSATDLATAFAEIASRPGASGRRQSLPPRRPSNTPPRPAITAPPRVATAVPRPAPLPMPMPRVAPTGHSSPPEAATLATPRPTPVGSVVTARAAVPAPAADAAVESSSPPAEPEADVAPPSRPAPPELAQDTVTFALRPMPTAVDAPSADHPEPPSSPSWPTPGPASTTGATVLAASPPSAEPVSDPFAVDGSEAPADAIDEFEETDATDATDATDEPVGPRPRRRIPVVAVAVVAIVIGGLAAVMALGRGPEARSGAGPSASPPTSAAAPAPTAAPGPAPTVASSAAGALPSASVRAVAPEASASAARASTSSKPRVPPAATPPRAAPRQPDWGY